ncbi:MAG: hypothetical protein COA78_01545 [Blastopirellula sp.]|nr:MAG: hypothetical protein COA78_01545 [Blastopirellula sp.]
MSLNHTSTRRVFLKGIGLSVALPALESLGIRQALGAEKPAQATTASGAPLRAAYIYFPNGVIKDKWMPNGEGKDYELNESLKALEKHKADFQMITGLEHANGWAGKDGAGDHARANATFLTGMRPKKTSGADIQLGISIDQVMANHIGDATRFRSLELSCDGARKSGGCDSGYSCAYQYNISWRSDTTPMTPESNPRLVFERLFGNGSGEERQRNYQQRTAEQRSILDFVTADAQAIHKQLGKNDQRKVDEYLTGVREIEKRIEKSEKFGQYTLPDAKVPEGKPDKYDEHIRLMMDMMVLAFRTDTTRVASFMLAHDGSNRSFRDIGVSDGHHSLSHHRNDQEKMDKIQKIDTFYSEQFAYFLDQLKSVEEGEGQTLLDNSMVVYGSGLADANRHQHSNLPMIVAGKAGGALTPGKHLKLAGDTPASNLYLSMLDKMGIEEERFGDSTEMLTGI